LSAATAVLMLAATPSLAEYVNPIAFPQKDDPNDNEVVIEIPAGTSTKYETDGKTGHLFVDRFLAMSVAYPANYGSIPSTISRDGDPLDALVITRQPIYPGTFIRVRPIGLLKMIDGGDVDDKVVAVPISKVHPTYDDIKTIEDLPGLEKFKTTEVKTSASKKAAVSRRKAHRGVLPR
jgi:inorganic pyrophosphatase